MANFCRPSDLQTPLFFSTPIASFTSLPYDRHPYIMMIALPYSLMTSLVGNVTSIVIPRLLAVVVSIDTFTIGVSRLLDATSFL